MPEAIDERRVNAVIDVLREFMRLADIEPLPVLEEVAERLEIKEMIEHPPSAERHLLDAAAAYMRYVAAQRGGRPEKSVIASLVEGLAEED